MILAVSALEISVMFVVPADARKRLVAQPCGIGSERAVAEARVEPRRIALWPDLMELDFAAGAILAIHVVIDLAAS